MESTLDASSSTTSIKRKADEAFDALDDALRSRESRPSPPKRGKTSLYGSLEKYGISSKPSSSSTPVIAPLLTALLSRARSRKNRKQTSLTSITKASPGVPEYSPGSTDAFLHRLSTFNFATYSSKPPQIDAVAASKCGWINEGGKDRLYCPICRVGWVVAGREGMSKDAANALIEKQRQSLVSMHKDGCPWRVRQCDPLVYRIPLQSPASLARQIRAQAVDLEPIVDGISIRHPLSTNQVQAFVQTVHAVPEPTHSPPTEGSEPITAVSAPNPSIASLLVSLFGWSLVPPPPAIIRKSSSKSLTLQRTHSRASSVHSCVVSREGTPAPSGSNLPDTFITPVKRPIASIDTAATGKGNKATDATSSPSVAVPSIRHPSQRKDAMLHCKMCQRRVGLWAFAAPAPNGSTPSDQPQTTTPRPQRPLDLLREHRSYCPYVVRSTPLVSLPIHPSAAASSPSSPRTSFHLTRTGTSLSIGDTTSTNTNPSSAFNLRRTTSLLSHVRTGSVTSSASPSSSTSKVQLSEPNNLVEGWRAIYNTVLRFGMSERSSMRVQLQPTGNPQAQTEGMESVPDEREEDDAMNGVIELVEGVKRHGGKQLLSYVRNLLG